MLGQVQKTIPLGSIPLAGVIHPICCEVGGHSSAHAQGAAVSAGMRAPRPSHVGPQTGASSAMHMAQMDSSSAPAQELPWFGAVCGWALLPPQGAATASEDPVAILVLAQVCFVLCACPSRMIWPPASHCRGW